MDDLDYELKYKDNQEVLDLLDRAKRAEENVQDQNDWVICEDRYIDMKIKFDEFKETIEKFILDLDDMDFKKASEELQKIIDDA